MKFLIIFTLMTGHAMAAKPFSFRSSQSICGFQSSPELEQAALDEAIDKALERCAEEGFQQVSLEEIQYQVIPHSWGGPGCTPVSGLHLNGIRECL